MISVKINIKLFKKIKEKCKFNKPDMEAFTYMRDNYK